MRRFLRLSLLMLAVIAGCGDPSSASTSTTASQSTTSTQSTTTAPATTATTAATTTTTATTTSSGGGDIPRIRVEDGVKTEGLDTISVRVGETVRFEVEADIADEIHVHGFDITVQTIPDEEVLVEFVADATGIFEVEIEGLGLPIVDIEVTP